jgi:hypothetical protein
VKNLPKTIREKLEEVRVLKTSGKGTKRMPGKSNMNSTFEFTI